MIHDIIKGVFGALIPLVYYIAETYTKDLNREIEDFKESKVMITYKKSVAVALVVLILLFIVY